MVVVRSTATFMSTPAGRSARKRGSSARTRSTVSITLAFGSVITNTSTPGLPLASPPTRTFSTESETSPRSASRTIAPLRAATMSGM